MKSQISKKNKVENGKVLDMKKRAEIVKTFSERNAQYARQYLLPIEAEGPNGLQVTPSNYPHQVCVRHIHKQLDVTSATLAGGFTLVMNPDLSLPGYISTASAQTVPAARGMVGLSLDIIRKNGVTSLSKIVASDGGVETIFNPVQITDGAAKTLWGINLVASPATFGLTFARANQADYPTNPAIYYLSAGNVWTAFSSGVCMASEVVSAPGTVPIGALALGFDLLASPATETYGVKVHVDVGMDLAQVTATAPNSLPLAASKTILDLGIDSGRVISMSILATNTSPELANGGNISAARAPRSTAHFGDVPGAISVLPANRRYQGPAKDGAFVTWMPSQVDEFEVDSVSNKKVSYSESEVLIVNVDGWGGGAVSSFKIQLDWLLEFRTPNQLFEKVLTPFMDAEFEALFHLLLAMPAATCNPGHLDTLKALLRGSVRVGKKVYGMYDSNRALIDPIIKAVGLALV